MTQNPEHFKRSHDVIPDGIPASDGSVGEHEPQADVEQAPGLSLRQFREGLVGKLGLAAAVLAAGHFAMTSHQERTQPGPNQDGVPVEPVDTTSPDRVAEFLQDHTVQVDAQGDMVTIRVDGADSATGVTARVELPREVRLLGDISFNWAGVDYSQIEMKDPAQLDTQTQATLQAGLDQVLGELAPYTSADAGSAIASVKVDGVAFRSFEGDAKSNQILSEATAEKAEQQLVAGLAQLGYSDADVHIQGIGEMGSEADVIAELEITGYAFHSTTASGQQAEVTRLIQQYNRGESLDPTVQQALANGLQRGVSLEFRLGVKPVEVVVPPGTDVQAVIGHKDWALPEERRASDTLIELMKKNRESLDELQTLLLLRPTQPQIIDLVREVGLDSDVLNTSKPTPLIPRLVPEQTMYHIRALFVAATQNDRLAGESPLEITRPHTMTRSVPAEPLHAVSVSGSSSDSLPSSELSQVEPEELLRTALRQVITDIEHMNDKKNPSVPKGLRGLLPPQDVRALKRALDNSSALSHPKVQQFIIGVNDALGTFITDSVRQPDEFAEQKAERQHVRRGLGRLARQIQTIEAQQKVKRTRRGDTPPPPPPPLSELRSQLPQSASEPSALYAQFGAQHPYYAIGISSGLGAATGRGRQVTRSQERKRTTGQHHSGQKHRPPAIRPPAI